MPNERSHGRSICFNFKATDGSTRQRNLTRFHAVGRISELINDLPPADTRLTLDIIENGRAELDALVREMDRIAGYYMDPSVRQVYMRVRQQALDKLGRS